ncbi:MAG: hypothetical protein ABL958_12050 [Bdellovibrionia bacterium]
MHAAPAGHQEHQRSSKISRSGFQKSRGSSSLVGRYSSAINPRAILFSRPVATGDPNFVTMGFIRGEQFVEFLANDPVKNEIALFLFSFKQACNFEPGGCSTGELLTPEIEKNWVSYTLYEDVDLKNTVVDCLQCHQPNGPGTKKIMRLQEFLIPWTHFIRNKGPTFSEASVTLKKAMEEIPGYKGDPNEMPGIDGGLALLEDFRAAHGTFEEYAGIPARFIPESAPILLENMMRFQGFEPDQTFDFRGLEIETEIKQANARQPWSNILPGISPTWTAMRQAFLLGNAIAPPYHDVKVTDPVKLAAMTDAYARYRKGFITAKELPDIRDVLPDEKLAKLGFGVEATANGRDVLVQACAQCHNSRLDQSLSRARFNAMANSFSPEVKETVKKRLLLPEGHLLRMPPTRFRALTEEQKHSLLEYIENAPE